MPRARAEHVLPVMGGCLSAVLAGRLAGTSSGHSVQQTLAQEPRWYFNVAKEPLSAWTIIFGSAYPQNLPREGRVYVSNFDIASSCPFGRLSPMYAGSSAAPRHEGNSRSSVWSLETRLQDPNTDFLRLPSPLREYIACVRCGRTAATASIFCESCSIG